MKTRILSGAAIGALALAALVAPMAAQAAPGDAELSVVHGIPGTTVDVWVNGKLTLNDFTPGTVAGPLALAAGTYSVAITPSNATSATDRTIIGPVDLPLAANMNYTAVAHLKADGKPTATLFTNDISKTAPGQGRLTVRHVAAAPAVDVVAGGAAVVSNLTNPNEKVLNLAAGTVSASVTATGTLTPALIGPADVAIKEGVNTIVYAYGSATAPSTLALAVQTISGLHTPPAGVPTGETGAAAQAIATQNAQQGWSLGVGGLVVLAVAVLTGCTAPAVNAATYHVTPTPQPLPTAVGPAIPRTDGRLSAQDMHPTIAPVHISIPAASVDMEVVPQGLAKDGQMAVPANSHIAGWYEFGPGPKSANGTTVIVAHIDARIGGIGPFSRIKDLPAGSPLAVQAGDGSVQNYVTTAVEEFAKAGAPMSAYFDRAGAARLVLITCGGQFNSATGHYLDNIAVIATPQP